MNYIAKLIKKFSRSSLAKESVITFIIKILSIIFMLTVSVLLARLLRPTQLGYYYYATSIINLLIIPASLGLPTLLVRLLSTYRVKLEWGLMAGLIKKSRQFVIYSSFLISLIFVVIAIYMSGHVTSLHLITFLCSLLLIPIIAFNSTRRAILRAFDSVIFGQIPEYIARHFFMIIFIGVCLIFNNQKEFTSVFAMVLNVLATFAAFLLGLYFLKLRTPREILLAKPEFRTKEWGIILLPLLFTGSLQTLNRNLDIIFLGTLAGPESAANYTISTRIADTINFALFSLNLVMGPIVAKYYTQNNIDKIKKLMIINNRVLNVYAVTVFLIFVFFGRQFITFAFGPEYAPSYLPLIIISIGTVMMSLTGSVTMLLNMTGHQVDVFKGFAVSVGLNALLNLILIPMYGMIGAAISSVCSTLTLNIILYVYVRKRLRFNPSALIDLSGKLKWRKKK